MRLLDQNNDESNLVLFQFWFIFLSLFLRLNHEKGDNSMRT